MIRILLIIAIILAIISLPAYFRMSQERRQRLNRLLLIGIVLILLSRALPGLFGLVVPLIAALIAGLARLLPVLIRYAPLLHRFWLSWRQQSGATASQRPEYSAIKTRFLSLHLNHFGQPISGTVISGTFAGRPIASLSKDELAQLMKECSSDRQSLLLLQLLIKQSHGSHSSHRYSSRSHRKPGTSAQMSVEQAYKILGLRKNASRKEIIAAHRRLMQKAHPDHGGSDELAAQINAARDVLLK